MASKLQILTQTDDEEEVGLYFVVPRNLNKNDCDDDMKQAFKTAADNEYTPEWKTEESCLLLSPSKRNVFVFQTFKGAAFEHLQQFKCVSLIGPRCLTHCIMLGEPMPLVMNPSFTLSMKDLKITVSGCGVELKNKIRQKIEMMSGVFLKSLTSFTTHVVVSSVVSSKYEKALEWGVPVRTLEWVDAVWESSLKEYVFATDEKFNEYRCPPFLNLRVASTGLNVREQDQLKSTLSKYGGQYDKSLSCQVNVLVVKKSKGDKYSHAKLWGIPCVQLRWIHDCVKAGNALPTKAYEVVGTAASSPKSSNATLNFSANLSTVQCDQKTHIDETMLDSTTSSVASFCPIPRSKTPVKMPPPAPRRTPVKCRTPVKSIVQPTAPGEFKHLLAELDLNQTRRAGPFLDGCGIYIVGWNTEEEEILRKVLKCSGATRFSDLNDRVSHILVGNLEKPFLRVLKNLSHTPHVVNIKWLIESLAQKSPAQEEHFYCMASENMNVSEAPSPLSKKGMALLQRETFSPKKSLAVQPSSSKVTEMSPNKGKQQLLAKYTATDSSDNSISKSMSTSSRCMPPPPVPAVKSTKQPHNVSSADESDLGGSEDFTFAGLNFVIVGLENSTSYVEEELLQKYGGKVVPKSFKGVPDYAVVPLPGATLKQTATEIVTVLWLESCIEARSILPISYYHQPVVLDVNKRPLEGCVLCLSGYCGKERQFIIELASALGAVCQEVFVRKSKNSAKASSHLICKSSEGSEKFNAAVKWFRPAVYHSWLLACAASGTQVPEKDHLVDPSQEVKPLLINNSNSVMSDVSSRCATSKRVESATVAALRLLPCFKTPERTPVTYDKEEVDRILNYVPSPNPYEVKTPPVPLGISENPTPGESKWVQKWLDRVPGKLPKPSPSPNPRRDSTPLHELRKKILEKHTISSPELMKILHGEDEDCDTSIADSAVALKNDLRNENVKSPPVACSTPTVSSCSVTSRKLFESNENDNNPNSEPIDIHLDKLNKLIATPELKVETALVSARTSNVSFIDNKCHKNQDFYDTLKDGSQPYAIKWEDPVHAKRTPKDGSARPDNQINETNEEELSTKRKSSEIAEEDEPPAKRKSSESAESSAESKKTHTVNVKSFKENAHPVTHRFSFSHIDDKGDWVGIIRKLGGTVSDSSSYNPNSTHLLLAKAPVRSEKLLAFIAAGKWILHVEYLLESGKQGKFVEEEGYELGNPNGKLAVTYKANSVEDLLSKAARRWRTRVGKEEVTGAFEGFKCKILTLPDKAVPFSRLIHAGKGQVLPEDSLDQPNFCLVNLTSHKHKIQEYAKLGIPCLPVTYLYEYLTQEPPPKPESRAIEEYKVLRAKYLAEN